MVINTNVEAQRTANNLNVSQTNLAKSLSRLSSGSRIVNPSDDAAGLAVSSRLRAQIKRLDSALSNVVNAVSFTQTQDGFMKTVDKAFRRMGELAMLARDETKSSQDRALYDQEFQQLKDYVIDSTKKEFNSVPLFDGTDIAVTIDSEGDTFDMTGIDMTAVSYTNGLTRTDPSVSGVSSAPGSSYAAAVTGPPAVAEVPETRYQLSAIGHGYTTGDAVVFGETAPGALVANTTVYFVEAINADTFYLHAAKTTADAGTAGSRLAMVADKVSLLAFGPPTAASIAAGTATSAADVSIGVHIQTALGAETALTKVKTAISQVAQDRAALGAVQSRLNFTNEQLSVTKENLSSAISRIADVDVAEEATQYARYQILVQSGTQMLTQANNLPNAALQLLRG